jgi:polyvinyl alcohol dehydrogenase (cytochrome)
MSQARLANLRGARATKRLPRAGALAVIGAISVLSTAAGGARNKTSAQNEGQALYAQRCANCHDGGVSRAPMPAALAQMSQEDIRFALTQGSMSAQGANLTRAQIDALARFLSKQTSAGNEIPQDAFFCHAGSPIFAPQVGQPEWIGWGADLSQHRFQPAEMAQLSADQVPKLKLKWAFAFPAATQAYAQPAVIGGRIFVGSANHRVYSLDAGTGCTYWVFRSDYAVRAAVSVGKSERGWSIYFGDQHANAYALDAATGKLIWKTRLDDHPSTQITGAPTLAGDKLYVGVSSLEEVAGADAKDECCKFRGSVSSLDTATGKVIWKSYTIAEEPKRIRKNRNGVQLWGPSGAGVWSSPTVDPRNRMVYVTTGDNYSDPPASTSDSFMAFHMDTGKLAWSTQITKGDAYNVNCDIPKQTQVNCPRANGPDFDFGSSPILVNLPNGRRALIAGQKSGVVSAVDPDHQGAVLWQTRVGHGGSLGGVQWGSAADANNIYVAVSDVERRAAPAGSPAGRASVFGVPYELDPKAGGGLFALKLDSGQIAWHTPAPPCIKPGCSPAQSAAVTAIPGVVFSGGVDGHLRAYSTENGKIIWDADTMREYATVNGVKGQGGSLDGPGPVIAGGILYVNSGYFFQGSAPGNVLLAFSVDGK